MGMSNVSLLFEPPPRYRLSLIASIIVCDLKMINNYLDTCNNVFVAKVAKTEVLVTKMTQSNYATLK